MCVKNAGQKQVSQSNIPAGQTDIKEEEYDFATIQLLSSPGKSDIQSRGALPFLCFTIYVTELLC